MKNFSILIPTYNEEKNISQVISDLKSSIDTNEYKYEIIVIDDGSTDNTRQISENLDVNVINHSTNMGYGHALMTGIKFAKYDYIATIDADSSYPANELNKLLDYIDGFDLVIGARKGKEFWGSVIKYPARLFFLWLAEFTAGVKIPDVNSGLRIFKKSSFEKISLPLLCRGFSFSTTMTLSFLLSGLCVKYIPIKYLSRSGHSKVRYIRDTLRTLQALTEVIIYYNPMKIIILLCIPTILAGFILLYVYVVFRNPVWLIGLIICFCFTITFFIYGLILDLLRMNRTQYK